MEKVNKGKKLVIGLIVIFLLLDIVVTVLLSSLYDLAGRTDLAYVRLIQGVFRLILTGVLMYFMYKGHKWAKWLLVVFFLLGGIFGLLSLISNFNLIMIVLSLAYICFGSMMIFSRCINTFYLYQRGLYPSDMEELN